MAYGNLIYKVAEILYHRDGYRAGWEKPEPDDHRTLLPNGQQDIYNDLAKKILTAINLDAYLIEKRSIPFYLANDIRKRETLSMEQSQEIMHFWQITDHYGNPYHDEGYPTEQRQIVEERKREDDATADKR